MAAFVYLMCTLAALLCCILLFRGWRRSRSHLLFWSGLCFLFLTLENTLLYIDRIMLGPNIDWTVQRLPLALIAVSCLLYGAIWKNA